MIHIIFQYQFIITRNHEAATGLFNGQLELQGTHQVALQGSPLLSLSHPPSCRLRFASGATGDPSLLTWGAPVAYA